MERRLLYQVLVSYRLQVKNNRGFTLVEMLLVLSIVSIIGSLVFVNMSSAYESKKINHFMEQFYIDLLYAQEYAMSHGFDVKIHFREGHYEIRGSSYNDPTILKRTYEEDIRIDVMTVSNPVLFKKSGNIQKPGAIFIGYKERRFRVMFQLGRGRIYYEKIR
jgi:competence protein ComGD